MITIAGRRRAEGMASRRRVPLGRDTAGGESSYVSGALLDVDPPSGSALSYPGENSSSSSEKDSNRCNLLHVGASYGDVLMSGYCNSGMVQDASHSRSLERSALD